MSNLLPKWLVSAVTILWMALILGSELLSVGSGQFGVNAPSVELAMQGCTSEDMHQRYECKEKVILANQRQSFLKATGFGFVLLGPPVAFWLLVNRLRRLDARSLRPDRRPPSIAKWRVR
jgi:hypothetical protein